jgi:aromatic ring-opening dioxygenase catalytic subunit (LigB family)
MPQPRRPQSQRFNRRQSLATGVAGLAALVAAGRTHAAHGASMSTTPQSRMPVAFLPHGGGPWPFVEFGLPRAEIDGLSNYLKQVPTLPRQKPKALVVVSAHWEERVPTVMSAAAPSMLYDYYGFPPASYKITWPAPGNPTLAAQVRGLLGKGGFATAEDKHRGYDHGTFVPLKVAWPNADVPVVQLSLKAGLDPEEHLAMGRALAPLRDEGVFILGSGNTFHNMRAFGDPAPYRAAALQFDAWLQQAGTANAVARDKALADWARAPAAQVCHPREEHLIPLMVVAGAAGVDPGVTTWSGTFGGLVGSAFHFG